MQVSESSMQSSPLLIVGIGASAGGLDAFQEFLRTLGDVQSIAVVFVMHLEVDGEGLLVDLLSQSTPYKVVKATNRKRLSAGTVYVCPARTLLEVNNGVTRFATVDGTERPPAPIDHFFQSLAEDQKDRSVGIILSGTGSDGTLGVKAISDAGGTTFAQSPESARYDSMPRSAATTGVTDHVLSPTDIATELKKYASFLAGHVQDIPEQTAIKEIHEVIPAIANLLMEATNHNFQHYKVNTLTRRIRRRMHVLKLANVQDYIKFLAADLEEPQKLFRELLISVTEFFRDPEAFDLVAQSVIPNLFINRKPDEVVRIWVPGCATGEEAFSLAMLCREHMDQLQSPPEVQIFATDIDERALQIARQCTYPIGIEEDISEDRLARFFVKRGKKYQLVKEIRNLVLFSTHNLISDPPFSRQDFISCRNLLIYLGPHLQKKLIPLFHYALRPGGFLMLGPSENIASHGELFRTIDAKYRISQRKGTGVDGTAALSSSGNGNASPTTDPSRPQPTSTDRSHDLMQVMQRIVLDEFAPKSVIIEEDGKILCTSADMHKYLTVGTGSFQNNIIKMARDGLRVGLRAALQQAKTLRRRVVHDDLSVQVDGKLQPVMLTIQPMPRVGEEKELFIVVFHDCGLPLSRDDSVPPITRGVSSEADERVAGADAIIDQLERELASTRADLEDSIRDLETANEELKSSNEELRSLNEEMQSANEELETSKEEIQSGVIALGKIHSDLENLFQSTQVATLFLDANYNIVRFTPATTEIYNLISTDLGRPLSHITHKVAEMPRVPTLAEVVTTGQQFEEEIHALDGRWFLRRVSPYYHDQRAEGVILTFIDITERKRSAIRLSMMYQVSRILASDPDMDSIFPEILQAIRATLNAACCSIWLVDPTSETIRLADSAFDVRNSHVKRFVDQSRTLQLSNGIGLPGCVWQSRETIWVEDLANDANFVRREFAAETGFVSGVALPIILGSQVYGVIELFTVIPFEGKEALSPLLLSVGNEIGQFVLRKKLAEELREEEARKSSILESALDAIVTMDKEGHIVDFNPAAERTFGYSKNEVRGKSLWDTIIPEEYRDAHSGGLEQCLPTANAAPNGRRIELPALRRDGVSFPIELALSTAIGRDGNPFFTAYMRDISVQRRFVQEIIDRDNQITALLNSTAEGIYGIGLDGRCTFANASCARLLGYDHPDQLLGKHMHDLIHHTRPDGTHHRVEDCKIYSTFLKGLPTHADDEVYWRADGTSIDIEYWSFPQIYDGKIIGCVVSFLNITERKKLINDLADREAHLRRVIDNMLGFVGVLNTDGILQDVNEAALIAGGVSREDVIGKPFWDCYWWSHDSGLIEKLKQAIATALNGEVVRYDTVVRTAFDSRLNVDFMLAPVKDSSGKVTYLIPSGVDISERKAAELEVKQRVAQLDLALESGRMGMWEWDISSDEVRWSSQLYELFGYSKDTFVPTKAGFLSIVHPDDRDRLERLTRTAFTGTCVNHEVEFRVIRGDNHEVVWTHCRGAVRRATDGRPTAILSALVDVTDRKQRELTLEFLTDLHSDLSGLSTTDAIIGEASRKVAEYLQLSHFLVIEIDENAAQAVALADYCRDGSSSLMGVYDMTHFVSEDERQQLTAGQPVVVNDTSASTRPPNSIESFAALNIGSFINAPSSRDQRLRFMLSATKQLPHVWRKDEIDLMRELSNIIRLKLDRANAQRALTESESKFRLLADNISQFAWMTDATGSIFWYNQRWFDFTGTTLEEMKDWGWQKVQHPDHLERVLQHWKRCLTSGTVWEDIFPLRSKTGEYRWFLSRAQPIRDETSNIVRWFGTNTDITETKEAEEALAESKQRLSMAMESARMGTFEWEPESDIATWDDQHLALTGLTKDHRSGADFFNLIHPDDIAEHHEAIASAIKGESDYEMEFRVKRLDGTLHWFAGRGKVVRSENNRPLRFIGLNWDITEAKEQEQRIRESEERLRSAAEAAGFGMVHVDLQTRTATLSDELHRLIGIAGSEQERIVVNSIPDWIHEEDKIAFANYVRHLTELKEGNTSSIDLRINRTDGEIRWVRLQAKPVYTGSGDLRRATQLIGTVLDITKQREFEQSLTEARAMAEAANDSKSAFLANMSHEIRTPMTAILGYTDLVADLVQDDQAAAHLRTIRRNGYFLLDIINDILDLSKIEAGMLEVVREQFAPVQLVEDVRSIMEVRATENQLTLEVEYRGMIPNRIESDAKRLKQILINIVGNAIKFTKKGRVQVVVSYQDEKLTFEIIDTGIGISKRQMKRLFQPFSQGDHTVNREFGGTGLGLVISQRLAGMLGGSITVESESKKGSKFTVSILTGNVSDVEYIQPSSLDELQANAGEPTAFHLDCHILVVDDRRDIRFLSRRFLTEAGATVGEAEDGEVALQYVTKAMAEGGKIDLIMLDMQMPKLDGYETARQLRKLGFVGPIIALTADAMQGDMTRCIECGCNNYLSKPIDKAAMLRMVSSYMPTKSNFQIPRSEHVG